MLLSSRGVRAFADGFVSVVLPVYLLGLGFDGLQIGAVATATLVGSAALTLLVGFIAHRFRARPLLSSAALLMAATGAERPAAASVTAVPRSPAQAAPPLLSGYLLGLSSGLFAKVRPPEEVG